MTINNNTSPNAAIPVHGMSSSVLEHTLEKPMQIYYSLPNDETNFWMYAMIALGCVFVVFVIGSIYNLITYYRNNPPSEQPQPLNVNSPCTTKNTNTHTSSS